MKMAHEKALDLLEEMKQKRGTYHSPTYLMKAIQTSAKAEGIVSAVKGSREECDGSRRVTFMTTEGKSMPTDCDDDPIELKLHFVPDKYEVNRAYRESGWAKVSGGTGFVWECHKEQSQTISEDEKDETWPSAF